MQENGLFNTKTTKKELTFSELERGPKIWDKNAASQLFDIRLMRPLTKDPAKNTQTLDPETIWDNGCLFVLCNCGNLLFIKRIGINIEEFKFEWMYTQGNEVLH